MSDVNEWTEASDGSYLHHTTVQYRMDVLKWTKAEAVSRPVRFTPRNDEESIANRARSDVLTPGKVQTLMRTYGVTYEEARDYLRKSDT